MRKLFHNIGEFIYYLNPAYIFAFFLVLISTFCLLTNYHHKHTVEELKAQIAEMEHVIERDSVIVDDLIEENNVLYYRLSKYEKKGVLWAKNWIINKNKRIDIDVAQVIAEAVCNYSEKNELDYKLVLSIIWHESRFNTTAKSNQNAHGLMQIIPETQKAIAKELKIAKWNINDIDTNVMFGTKYLARLKLIYNNDYSLMLASYNGGPTQAKKWKKYIAGELPVDSLSNENYNYITNVLATYRRM